MSPELYFAVMLITNPQKAKRILLAEELENWFMDLFDDEVIDLADGSFVDKQEEYIDRIVDKYLSMTSVKITDTDEYAKSVIDKAFKVASEIQDTTWKNLVKVPLKQRSIDEINVVSSTGNARQETKKKNASIADLILSGIAIGSIVYANENILKWLGKDRANLIALNEANWKWNNEEFFDAKEKHRTKTWHTALDEKVRVSHIEMEGVTVDIDSYFIVGGFPMRYPCDFNAPINEIANCRCTVTYK